MLVVRKMPVGEPYLYPCRTAPKALDPLKLTLMQLDQKSKFGVGCNIIEGYAPVSKVTLPIKKHSSRHAQAAATLEERAHIALFKSFTSNSDAMLEKIICKGADGSLDVAASVKAAGELIAELDDKVKERAALTPSETAFFKKSKTKAQHLSGAEGVGAAAGEGGAGGAAGEGGGSAAAGEGGGGAAASKGGGGASEDDSDGDAVVVRKPKAHGAPRPIALRNSERMPELFAALLTRFCPMQHKDKLLVLDACCGTGSVARSLLHLTDTLGVLTGSVSIDCDDLVIHYAKQVFDKEVLAGVKLASSKLVMASKQNESATAFVHREPLKLGDVSGADVRNTHRTF